jgi:beta-lactam-binding protein with PASTA domain
MLDNPGDRSYAGGLVSAPIFKAIAEKIYATSARFAGKTTALTAVNMPRAVPDVMTLKLDAAKAILAAQGFDVETRGDGTVVMRQSPAAGTRSAKGSTVVLVTMAAAVPAKGYAIVPEVRGLPLRRAVNRLALQQIDVAITGSGVVVSQSPPPGESVRTGARIILRCEPKNLPLLTLY